MAAVAEKFTRHGIQGLLVIGGFEVSQDNLSIFQNMNRQCQVVKALLALVKRFGDRRRLEHQLCVFNPY